MTGGRQVAVETVQGAIPSDELGVTLVHEHLLVNMSPYFHPPPADDPRRQFIANAPMSAEFQSTLRNDPFASRDNLHLDDHAATVSELRALTDAGGQTVVDPTSVGMGRSPGGLRAISEASGVNVVMGTGLYIDPFWPHEHRMRSIEELMDSMLHDITNGADGSAIRAGVIGEIGVSREFTTNEERCLRAAARAQAAAGVPLFVHLPGWRRYGHQVLDIVAEEGGNLAATVLCHMNPSHHDSAYQRELTDRTAWLGYDMLGMDWYYADADEQCPSDDEVAASVAELVDSGYQQHLLLSSDVFLKMMLLRYGGNGYAHTLNNFLPRLQRHGLTTSQLEDLIVTNPRRLFEAAAALRDPRPQRQE